MATTIQVAQFTECTRYCEAMLVNPKDKLPVYVPVVGWGLCEVFDDVNEVATTKTAAMIYDNSGGLSIVYSFAHFIKLIFDPRDKEDVLLRRQECLAHLAAEQVEAVATTAKDRGVN